MHGTKVVTREVLCLSLIRIIQANEIQLLFRLPKIYTNGNTREDTITKVYLQPFLFLKHQQGEQGGKDHEEYCKWITQRMIQFGHCFKIHPVNTGN